MADWERMGRTSLMCSYRSRDEFWLCIGDYRIRYDDHTSSQNVPTVKRIKHNGSPGDRRSCDAFWRPRYPVFLARRQGFRGEV